MKTLFIINMNETPLSPPLIDRWLEVLQASGYRLTGPRRALVELIANTHCAVGALELYDTGRKEYPGLGLVTVYRTLEKLEELGLIQRVHQPAGCNMYLPSTHCHEHLLLCTSCGQALYFSGDDLAPLMEQVTEKTGFLITQHWLQLFGVCPKCREKSS